MNTIQPANSPYPGLRPYREDEQNSFFGRDIETRVLIDKILVHRLTLLFAATGVGKSSMLQAAVMPHLKAPLGENLDVVYYIDWVSPPLEGLKQAVRQALQQSGSWRPEITYTPPADEKLSDFFSFCTLFVRQPLVVVLDQFEEFFRYQRGGEAFQPFLEQLTNVITASQLPVHVVFSMREDFALELNAFKPYMPLSLFDNFYRLEKLDKAGAKAAILTPLQAIGYQYEPALLEKLLNDLLSRDLDREGNNPLGCVTESVEPPYLQIVCSQLWAREHHSPDKTLHLSTYQAAGGAVGLVQNYIHNTLNGFAEREKYLASRAFDHLISRHGAKMPYTPEDLAEAIGANTHKLQAVLEKLAKVRILRSQQREDKIWYELYHDMFAGSIEGWNSKQREKIHRHKLLIFMASILGSVGIITVGAIWSINKFNSHFRLGAVDNSRIEVYGGRYGWPDPFNQQKYIYETKFKRQEIELDKRFEARSIQDKNQSIQELISSLPLREKVAAYANGGFYSKKLEKNIAEYKTAISCQREISIGSTIIFKEDANNALNRVFKGGEVKKALIRQISKTNDQAAFQMLIEELSTKDLLISAIDALSSIGSNNGIPYLKTVLITNTNDEVRKRAIEALGMLEDVSSIEIILNILSNNAEDKSVQAIAAKALGKIGIPNEKVINQLIEKLGDEEYDVRLKSSDALVNIGGKAVINSLVPLFDKEVNPDILTHAALALRRIGSPDAIPVLVQQLNNANKDIACSAAKALGGIGDPGIIKNLMAVFNKIESYDDDDKEYYKNLQEDIRTALTMIKHPAVDQEIIRLNLLDHKNEKIRLTAFKILLKSNNPRITTYAYEKLNGQSQEVKQQVATVAENQQVDIKVPYNIYQDINKLGDLYKQNDGYNALEISGFPASIKFDIEAPKLNYTINDFITNNELKNIYGNAKEQRLLLDALNTPPSLMRDDKFLKIAEAEGVNIGIRTKAIESLSPLNNNRTIIALRKLRNSPVFNIQGAALSKLSQIQYELDQPVKVLADTSLKLSARVQIMENIGKFINSNYSKQEILRIAEQNENELSRLAYRLLGDLQITEALPLLEKRLQILDDQYREWRELRDSKSNNPSDEDLNQIKKAKSQIREGAAFDYGYAISRLDPERGMKLLTHNLAEVRQGAYTGFAMKANIQWLKKLDAAREVRYDDPIFCYETFHAIDLGLRRLEIIGKPKEIAELQAWLTEIKGRQTPINDPDDEVYERIEWTTKMMERYQKLEEEFKRDYDMVRIWPKDTLPVNQPYPNEEGKP